MSYSITEIDPLSDPAWSQFVQSHPSASVFHTRGWLEALHRTYGYGPAALVGRNLSGMPIAALPFCRVDSWVTGKRIISLPFSDHCQPLVEDETTLQEFSEKLIELAHEEQCRGVEIRPCSALQHVAQFGAASFFYLHRLDLRPGLTEVFRRFHRDSIQRKIRRADREKLRIEAGAGPHLIRHFHRLVLRTRRRHGLPAQPIAWFRNLANCMGPSLVISVAYKDQQPIAGILTIEHQKTIVYKYGASDERFHNLGGMACVFWHRVQDAIARGLEEMDMGRSDLDNPGLATFKEHWGATRSELTYWKCPPAKPRNSGPSWKTRLAQRACNYAPDFLLGAMGSLLYRHMG